MFKRLVTVGSGLVALGAVLAFAGFATGTDPQKRAAASPPAGGVTTTAVRSRNTAGDDWSAARIAGAKPLDRTRGGTSSQSFGSANLDFSRTQINPRNSNTKAPYNAVGKLYFTIPGSGDFQCSASLVAKRLVLTAGHCLYGSGGFFTDWIFIPGFDGQKPVLSTQRPYGTWTAALAAVPSNYASTYTAVVNNYDFGMLMMDDQSFNGNPPVTLRQKVGFNLTTVVGHLFDTAIASLGYPCNLDACQIMQRVDSSDHRSSGVPGGSNGDTAYEYGSDMAGGSSGGPWVENLGTPSADPPTGGFNERNAVVAVTSYGYNDVNVRAQGASQLNGDFTAVRDFMCAQAPGNC